LINTARIVVIISDKAGKESNRKDLLAEYELMQHLGTHDNVVLVLGGVTLTGENGTFIKKMHDKVI
jgi:hypothetical protein